MQYCLKQNNYLALQELRIANLERVLGKAFLESFCDNIINLIYITPASPRV